MRETVEFSRSLCGFPQEEVMVLERILLQTIKFDLQVEHPYMFLMRYVKQLKGQLGLIEPNRVTDFCFSGVQKSYECFFSCFRGKK